MELSLKDRIIRYLREDHMRNKDRWTNGGEIERLALLAGYKASNASRRLRELSTDGKIERKEINGSVNYRYI